MDRSERESRQRRLRDLLVGPLILLGLLTIAFGSPHPAAAQVLSVAETESLVRSIHFEGLPEEVAARVGPAGAARLIEMLNDPDESAAHANILIVLGICGEPGAYDAIDDWASTPRDGEIDRNTFRAWQALPFALGHVARHDRRAIARLEAQLDESAPTWTFRHHRGAKLHRQAQRAAATALGMTGLPEAAEVLERAGRRGTNADFDAHLREVRAMHRDRAARGRER